MPLLLLVDCDVLVHRHCVDRLSPCKAQIESGSYVTMSRKKVVQKLEDLDDLGQFLLDKVGVNICDYVQGKGKVHVHTVHVHVHVHGCM